MFNPFNVLARGSSVPLAIDFVTQFSTQMSKFNLWLRIVTRFGEFKCLNRNQINSIDEGFTLSVTRRTATHVKVCFQRT